jgi:isocitrate lyase
MNALFRLAHPEDDHLGAGLGQRFHGVVRPYTQQQVQKLRGTLKVEHTLAQRGARRLWELMHEGAYINALGAMTGGQAVQMAKAGLKAIYCSGWQAAADANLAGQTYPDQSLYPANSVPALVKRLNGALMRADQIEHAEGGAKRDWFLPIVADAEAGFGGPLNAFELMKGMIEAGAAGVHFEDQLSSEKKCGHLGGKVLVPTGQFIRTLVSARLAADVAEVPTVLIARTDADAARLITSDVDERDRPFLTGERTPEGFHRITGGLPMAIARAKAYAPYADVLWCETSTPDLKEAREFAEGVHAEFPGKLLAYNCSPSFNWKKKLSDAEIAAFQRELGAMGYRFQFVTLAGFHSLNHGMFELANAYRTEGMSAYARLQTAEFEAEEAGYSATRHQREVGTGYFDAVAEVLSSGLASTLALKGSTESEQFTTPAPVLGERSA